MLEVLSITRHPWVIPVVACDLRGRPIGYSNFGNAIGRRGLCAPGHGITSLGADGEVANIRRDQRCGAVRDGRHRVVDVDISSVQQRLN